MSILNNPNIVYALLIIDMTFLFLGLLFNKKRRFLSIVIVLLIALYFWLYLFDIELVAFIVTAISPVLYYQGVKREKPNNGMTLTAIFLLVIGGYLIIKGQGGSSGIDSKLAVLSVISALLIWSFTSNTKKKNYYDPHSVVGMLAEVLIDLEPNSPGTIMIEGINWRAYSKEFIKKGSIVRVTGQGPYNLTVKKVDLPNSRLSK